MDVGVDFLDSGNGGDATQQAVVLMANGGCNNAKLC
jgi:hypothetical protein